MQLLDWIGGMAVPLLGIWAVGWLVAFAVLRRQAARLARRLADRLHNLTAEFARRPDRDSDRGLHDEIDVLLAAVREALADPARSADRAALARRLDDRDGDKPDLVRQGFERLWSLARAQIEALPLAGVCATLLRMWVALGGAGPAAAASTAADPSTPSDVEMADLTRRFAEALAGTMVALAGTVGLIWANAWSEADFLRLTEQRAEYRAVLAQCRRELSPG